MANVNTTVAPADAEWAAESNTTQILTVVTIFNFLALGCVGARLYAKIWVIKAPHMDDWMMIPAAICSAGGGWVVFVIQAQYGLGKHYRTIDPADYVKFQHAAFFSVIVSSAAGMMFLKVSIALNLLRLSPSRWYQWSLWATIGLTVVYCVGGMFPFFLNCQPMSGYWDKSTKPVCMPLGMFIRLGVLNTSLNIFTDVVLATLPVPIVWNLQMELKIRLYVIGILSLGYLAVAMGIVKAVYQLAFGSDMDKTFHYHIFVWGFLQIQFGIIAACAPALRPLLARILRLTSHDGYKNDGDSPSQKNGTAVRGKCRRTMRSGTGPRFNRDHQYELNERAFGDQDSDRAFTNLGVTKVATAAFYRYYNSDKRSGSEERILQDDRPVAATGILKTIEVTVK
ncbi:integral membrane protein [Colletotrichum incanum]|nr:integral membrane protein [Colletotrichum incanum]